MIKKGYSKKQHTLSGVAKTLLLLFICLVSCQNENEEFNNDGNNDGRFKILPVFKQHSMEISTRALSGSYIEFEPNDGELIYAWAQRYLPSDSLIQGEFRRSSSKWYSSVEVKSGNSYKLFAFHPGGMSDNRGTFTQIEEEPGEYSYNLAVNPISIVTLDEPSIAIVAARSYYDESISDYTEPALNPGSYDLGAISANSLKKDKVIMAMNLLYSKVNLSFTLDTVYSKLRSIVLTSVKIVSDKGQSSMNLTFDDRSTPSWGAYTTYPLEVELLNPGDSIVLSTSTTSTWDGSAFSSNFVQYEYLPTRSFCYLPKSDLPVKLAVEYNVYTGDIKADTLNSQNYNERLARKNQPATNGKIMPSGTNFTPKAGTSYNVKISVKPSYLYVLTDDDLDIRLTIE
jgi:hypothetical protein